MSNFTENRIQIKLTDPQKEIEDLSQLLFGKSMSETLQYDQNVRRTVQPSKDQGLYAYFVGLLNGTSGYSYTEAEKMYGERLRGLQGAKAYLSGTGSCRVGGESAACQRLNDGRVYPLIFDFVDDGYNLVGAFEFLRKNFADGTAPQSCILSAATFGTENLPLCTVFHSHNLVAAPYTLGVRGLKDYLQTTGQPLPAPMSSCTP